MSLPKRQKDMNNDFKIKKRISICSIIYFNSVHNRGEAVWLGAGNGSHHTGGERGRPEGRQRHVVRSDADKPDIGEGLQQYSQGTQLKEALHPSGQVLGKEVQGDVPAHTGALQQGQQRGESHQGLERRSELPREEHEQVLQESACGNEVRHSCLSTISFENV